MGDYDRHGICRTPKLLPWSVMEFACESCWKTLYVPDGSVGRRCKCPHCGRAQVVPDDTVSVVEEPVSDGSVNIPCPKCQHLLSCQPNLLGTRGMCRACNHMFLITEDAAARAASLARPPLIFNCPKCDQLFEGREEMRGRKGKCHACGEVFLIQLKEPKETVVDPPAGSAGIPGSASPAPVVKPAPPEPLQPPPPIRFICSGCRGTMEVPGNAAGLSTACPFCNKILVIPTPPKPGTPQAARVAAPNSRPASTKGSARVIEIPADDVVEIIDLEDIEEPSSNPGNRQRRP